MLFPLFFFFFLLPSKPSGRLPSLSHDSLSVVWDSKGLWIRWWRFTRKLQNKMIFFFKVLGFIHIAYGGYSSIDDFSAQIHCLCFLFMFPKLASLFYPPKCPVYNHLWPNLFGLFTLNSWLMLIVSSILNYYLVLKISKFWIFDPKWEFLKLEFLVFGLFEVVKLKGSCSLIWNLNG